MRHTRLNGHAVVIGCLIVASWHCSRSQPETRDSTTWIDPSRLKPSPVRPDALTPQQIERIKQLQRTFADVDSSPPEKWVEDFSRDEHPEGEIQIYEAMASAYTAYVSRHTLSLDQRREVYGLVLLRSGTTEEEVMKNAPFKFLNQEASREVLSGFTAPPKAIKIVTQ